MALQIDLQLAYHVSNKFETPIGKTYKVWYEKYILSLFPKNEAFMPEISRFFGIEFVCFLMTIIRHMHQRKTIYNSIRKKVFKNYS
jgi:hypothetical protein